MKWKKLKFSDLYFEPSRNGIYKSKEHHGQGIKIVNMGELFSYDKISDQKMSRLYLDDSEIQRFGLCDGDLLFARRSLVESGAGKCSLVEGLLEPTTFESSIIRVRLNQQIASAKFYFYWVRGLSGRAAISSLVTGTNVKGIKGSTLKGIYVDYPPMEIQNKIADILSRYDDAIANNRRRIELLERSSRLLYREWFVHLRYPGHEHGAIDPDGIPEGWEKVTASEILDINPREKIEKHKEVWYVPMSSLSSSGMTLNLPEFERRTKHTTTKFRNDDTLFARITPCLENGKTAFVNFLGNDEIACGSTEFIVLRGRRVSPYFTYLLSRSHDFRENAIKSMIGSSGRQRVQVSCFDNFLLGVPPKVLMLQFDDAVAQNFSQIQNLTLQTQKLQEARDLLLPRLMNGEITV